MGGSDHSSQDVAKAEDYQRPLCAGGCEATGPARPERERRAIVSAEGATEAPAPLGPSEARPLNLSKRAICGREEKGLKKDNKSPFTATENMARASRRRRSRLFHRMTSGIKWYKEKHLRHMVLTSSPLSIEPDMNRNKKALVKRIERLTINKLIKKGYLDKSKVRYFYGNKDWDSPLEFIYFSVRTGEGVSGVWHIAWFGDFIPQKWVSEQWEELHHAPNISLIDHGNVRSSRRLVGYFLSHYFKHQDNIEHISWSWRWLKKGSVRKWKKMVKDEGIVKAIFIWNYMMKHQLDNPPPGQITLDADMAEHPFWVRGFIKKNKEFRI